MKNRIQRFVLYSREERLVEPKYGIHDRGLLSRLNPEYYKIIRGDKYESNRKS
ncbi:MAG: hypothetical protein U9R08_05160 [Nanoarchaeota archaeon]|nr:hypothetical protein [Nanoarchaeota archaeon]